MDDAKTVALCGGVILVLLGLTCILLTGIGPKHWRPSFGKVGATCLFAGVIVAVCAMGMT